MSDKRVPVGYTTIPERLAAIETKIEVIIDGLSDNRADHGHLFTRLDKVDTHLREQDLKLIRYDWLARMSMSFLLLLGSAIGLLIKEWNVIATWVRSLFVSTT